MSAFDWISQFFEMLALFVPRRVIVRATERGIKWKSGRKVVELTPGIHWYWPFTTDIEKMPVARQTMNLPDQALFTKDQHQVVVGAVVTYRITNIVLAMGEKNWDIEATLQDTSQSAVVDVISRLTLSELQDGIDTTVVERLTTQVRKQLRRYGISTLRVALTDFAACQVHKVLGINQTFTTNTPCA
jgi:regulator of protease activity HflC (stomatin/prohibitin superfamily)